MIIDSNFIGSAKGDVKKVVVLGGSYHKVGVPPPISSCGAIIKCLYTKSTWQPIFEIPIDREEHVI